MDYSPQVETDESAPDSLTVADDGSISLSSDVMYKALCAGQDAAKDSLTSLARVRAEILGDDSEDTIKQIDPVTASTINSDNLRAINGMGEAFDAAMMLFAVPRIATKVESRTLGQEGVAAMQSIRLDAIAERVRIAEHVEAAIACALMGGQGFIRTGLLLGQGVAQQTGELRDIGEVYAQCVLPEDVICDPNATSWDLQTWRAVRTVMPKRLAVKMYGQGDEERIARIKNLPRYFSQDGNEEKSIRKHHKDSRDADVLEMIEIWECYLFVEGKVRWAVYPCKSQMKQGPLVEWADYQESFEGGPLVRISFQDMPGMACGVSPLEKLGDLHQTLRVLSARLIKQVEEAKVGTVGPESSRSILEEVRAGADMQHYTVEDPANFQVVQLPYPPREAYIALQMIRGELNNRFINIAQSAGKNGFSDTAAEATILNNNAERLMSSMQERVDKFLSQVMDSINRWLMVIDANGYGPEVEEYKYNASGEMTTLILDERTREDVTLDAVVTARAKREPAVDPIQRAMLRLGILQGMPQMLMAHAQMQVDPAKLAGLMADEFDWPKLNELYGGMTGEIAQRMLAEVQAKGGMSMVIGSGGGGAPRTQRPPAGQGPMRPSQIQSAQSAEAMT